MKNTYREREDRIISGTQAGGKSAALTNKRKFGENFYSEIGKIGGKVSSPTKGFGSNRELAKIAGAKGGSKSSRPYTEEDSKKQSLKMKEYWRKRREDNL